MAIENATANEGLGRKILSRTAWPVLLVFCICTTAYGFAIDRPVIVFNLTYLALAIALFLLERKMPFEQTWLENDGQTFANIAHTLTSKGLVQGLVTFSGVIGITAYITPMQGEGYGIWPRDWPLAIQVIMTLVAAEFGLYWAHRISHEWKPLWKFHAIHHSVTRLWIVNTGRFHFIDSLLSIVLGISIPLALGAPLEAITWLSAITAYIGMLTHCNVDMRFGLLSMVFNTPGLHRWHHSKKIIEGNRNYGENLMVWDMVFGTWINPDRRPPAKIGITEEMPASFPAQLVWPFKEIKELDQEGWTTLISEENTKPKI
ncbi:sterol desaturase family protein [Kiloniella majae]|uniref:sterol desaturase family protein n=1 Tax=Kiloniella majae TaxID=1938558 RepID=UPI000A276F00|nr:sterol desaturase family protein [Kiloniella majae]